MLIKFSCKNHASVIIFGEVGLKLIKMMGHSGTVPSTFLAQDVPEALLQLMSSVEQEKRHLIESNEANEEQDKSEQNITIVDRAYPLIELLNSAVQGKCDVMWDKY